MTGYEILNIYDVLSSIVDDEFDLNTSCAIVKNLQEIEVFKKVIDLKRNKLIEKYAEKNENGEIIYADDKIKIIDTDSFNDEINKLLSDEVENINIQKIKKENISHIKISPKSTIWLMYIVE